MKFRIVHVVVASILLFSSLTPLAEAQTSTQTASALPRLVRFGGTAKDLNGNPLTGVVGITFALYFEKSGGAPLWLETQNATADSNGHYTVLLGSTKPDGLPAELFTSGQARWVGVQVSGQPEQPRVLLVSAPYALKAGDAETVGGLPPSAFVLAAPLVTGSAPGSSTAANVPPPAATDVTTTGGTLNYLPIFSGADTIIDSAVFQTGSGTTAKIGIDTTTPAAQLDVNGAGTIRGTLSLPATGNATAAGGKNSQGLNLVASSFSSTSSTALNQVFRWQAEPVGSDTAAPSGTLNLLYGLGTATPTETGMKLSSNGIFTFAAGQTFPTVTGNETVTGNISSDGSVSATTSFDIGGTPFAFGSTSKFNAFLGFSGNSTLTGSDNAAVGYDALFSDTTGGSNVASGSDALYSNTTGSYNIAVGQGALANNTTGHANTAIGNAAGVVGGGGALVGSNNTALGTGATFGTGSLTNATALGANAEVTESNAMVLGSIKGVNGQTVTVNVGIGTTSPSPSATLDVVAPEAALDAFHALDGVVSTGGSNPNWTAYAGNGVVGTGGAAPGGKDGNGGVFTGGNSGAGGDGIDAYQGSDYAGNFTGDLNVSGAITAGTKDFKIDHPLDPANRYLLHASVESSEMKNIYDGNVTTDSQGRATVQLPEWFEVLNTDFRYQLTVIGQFAQAIVAHEIDNNRFEIRTSAPNVKVSWQVTGVRQDAYAKEHPLVVEQVKEARLRGFYIHPEFYGAPPEKQIEWARHPQMMKWIQEMRAKQLTTIRAAEKPATPQSK